MWLYTHKTGFTVSMLRLDAVFKPSLRFGRGWGLMLQLKCFRNQLRSKKSWFLFLSWYVQSERDSPQSVQTIPAFIVCQVRPEHQHSHNTLPVRKVCQVLRVRNPHVFLSVCPSGRFFFFPVQECSPSLSQKHRGFCLCPYPFRSVSLLAFWIHACLASTLSAFSSAGLHVAATAAAAAAAQSTVAQSCKQTRSCYTSLRVRVRGYPNPHSFLELEGEKGQNRKRKVRKSL